MLTATIPRAVLVTVIVFVLALSGVLVVSAQATPTPTPIPKPNLVIDKVGTASGTEVVDFTITVTNIGNAPTSDDVIVQDTLSQDAYWFLLGATQSDGNTGADVTSQCKLIAGDPAGGTLICEFANIVSRHINVAEDDFVYGSVTVHVYGIARKCGVIDNTALFIHGLTIRSDSDSVAVPCPVTPTPTATATVPPPTQTPVVVVITATPTNTAVPTATPTKRVAPLPPNTGDTPPSDNSSGLGLDWLIITLGVLSIAFAAGGVLAARRIR